MGSAAAAPQTFPAYNQNSQINSAYGTGTAAPQISTDELQVSHLQPYIIVTHCEREREKVRERDRAREQFNYRVAMSHTVSSYFIDKFAELCFDADWFSSLSIFVLSHVLF